jgi:hypothetical protein
VLRDQLVDQRRHPGEVVVRIAREHHVGLAFDMAELRQSFTKKAERRIGVGEVGEPADARRPTALRQHCARTERERCG